MASNNGPTHNTQAFIAYPADSFVKPETEPKPEAKPKAEPKVEAKAKPETKVEAKAKISKYPEMTEQEVFNWLVSPSDQNAVKQYERPNRGDHK